MVTPGEVDELGHANNEAYLHWMNSAAVAHSASLGWPAEAYLRQGQGWVVRRHEIEYLHPVPPGANLIVRTWVQSFEKASSWRQYEVIISANRHVVARGRTLWAWIDYTTKRPSRIPSYLISAFPIAKPDLVDQSHGIDAI